MSRAAIVTAACAILVMSACSDPSLTQQQAVGRADGLQLTGQLAGHRMSISDGAPDVVLGDCDPPDGQDEDLCVLARTIDGSTLGLVIENPNALSAGTTIDVGDVRCAAGCDGETRAAIVEARLDGVVFRATGGRLVVTAWGERYAAEFTLRFADGSNLSGSFDVLVGIRGGTA